MRSAVPVQAASLEEETGCWGASTRVDVPIISVKQPTDRLVNVAGIRRTAHTFGSRTGTELCRCACVAMSVLLSEPVVPLLAATELRQGVEGVRETSKIDRRSLR